MGAREWHVARAKHHKEVADYLEEPYPDWFAVALFYSALQYVHSALADEPELVKDERHPRKHTAGPTPGNGGRGVNDLVRDLYPDINVQYRSLFEMSHRTRYDAKQLGEMLPQLLLVQYKDVVRFCKQRCAGRPSIPTQAP